MDYAANCRLGPWRTKLVPQQPEILGSSFSGYGVLGPGYWVAQVLKITLINIVGSALTKELPINCIKSLGNSLLLEGRLAT